LYQRLAARRGKKRAIIAVAHSMVVSAFHMLSRHEAYEELGGNYFDEQRRHHLFKPQIALSGRPLNSPARRANGLPKGI
jgi:hypothetical protein